MCPGDESMKVKKLHRPALVTGSHVYGKPTEDSDVDLVVVADFDDTLGLRILWEGQNQGEETSAVGSMRFGNLNLILVEPDEYDRWVKARERCLAEAPVTRSRAVEIHEEEKAGC
jgi:hypothetical protein